jgi:hypothetical protein
MKHVQVGKGIAACIHDSLVLDVRKHAQRGRSINMALSTRGLVALEGAGMSLEKVVMREAIPMRGRMIHTKGGRQSPQIYDIYGEVSIELR